MGGYVNLLSSLPKTDRNVEFRFASKDEETIATAKKYGYDYFDGFRKYGYGGYRYDGRWQTVAQDIVKFFDLKENSTILDVGCAKGFLAYDLTQLGMIVSGVDVSEYALQHSTSIKGEYYLASADKLPVPDKSFDLVISINTLHNLPRGKVIDALKEIERVSRGNSYVVVDSYRTPEEKEQFEKWVLTAETYGYPEEWHVIFEEAGYGGHYSWNLM